MAELNEQTVQHMAEQMNLKLKRSEKSLEGCADGYMIIDSRFQTIVVGCDYDLTLEDAAAWLSDLENTLRVQRGFGI